MTHSVRVSDELYELLQSNGQLMYRNIGQQLEFLARLGHALETSPLISAKQLQLLALSVREAEAASEVADGRFESVFAGLARMDGNPALQRQLAGAGRPITGRDEDGDLVTVDPSRESQGQNAG